MDRKEIIKVLGEHFGVKPKYLGVPSFDYEVGDFIVDREGTIKNRIGEEVKLEEILCNELNKLDLEIAFPLEGHTGISLRNLIHMIYSKQPLIRKALSLEENIMEIEFVLALTGKGIETVEDFKEATEVLEEITHKGIDFKEDKITFRLSNIDQEKIKIYTEFFSKLLQKSKELKYASAKVVETDNEKYSFRTWLMRLGMIGPEYKEIRKILLKGLPGNGAFRKVEVEKNNE